MVMQVRHALMQTGSAKSSAQNFRRKATSFAGSITLCPASSLPSTSLRSASATSTQGCGRPGGCGGPGPPIISVRKLIAAAVFLATGIFMVTSIFCSSFSSLFLWLSRRSFSSFVWTSSFFSFSTVSLRLCLKQCWSIPTSVKYMSHSLSCWKPTCERMPVVSLISDAMMGSCISSMLLALSSFWTARRMSLASACLVLTCASLASSSV
mmetsp:Transcript_45255/g.119560  ORF Transcript_45255/g.119560 Transcript_45255/m.119560 type:complete len:209 (-) Transcript_45255:1734-2360(-)